MQLVCATHPAADAIARCVNCGLHLCGDCRTLLGVRNVCSDCRARMQPTPPPLPRSAVAVEVPGVAPRVVTPKSPLLASALSLVPGLGQLYAGRWLRGGLFFASAMALREAWWISPLLAAWLYVFNLFDAWRLAQLRTAAPEARVARADDVVFLLAGLAVLATTFLRLGGFFAAPGSAVMPLALLATGLVVAHETRR